MYRIIFPDSPVRVTGLATLEEAQEWATNGSVIQIGLRSGNKVVWVDYDDFCTAVRAINPVRRVV